MNGQGNWNKVEWTASYFLLAVLFTVLIIRLGFVSVWPLPTLDLVLSWIAFIAVTAAFWFGRKNRPVRLWVIGYGAATQLIPMVIREPVLLLPIVGAAVPVGIIVWALIALSKKGQARASTGHS